MQSKLLVTFFIQLAQSLHYNLIFKCDFFGNHNHFQRHFCHTNWVQFWKIQQHNIHIDFRGRRRCVSSEILRDKLNVKEGDWVLFSLLGDTHLHRPFQGADAPWLFFFGVRAAYNVDLLLLGPCSGLAFMHDYSIELSWWSSVIFFLVCTILDNFFRVPVFKHRTDFSNEDDLHFLVLEAKQNCHCFKSWPIFVRLVLNYDIESGFIRRRLYWCHPVAQELANKFYKKK